ARRTSLLLHPGAAPLAPLLELLPPLDRLADRLEVRQQAAEPALADVRHPAAGRLLGDRLAGRALRADKEHDAPVRDELADELRRLEEQRQGLLQIDNVDLVTFAEDERGHLRVPEAGLVSEMDARFQHTTHRDVGHRKLLLSG